MGRVRFTRYIAECIIIIPELPNSNEICQREGFMSHPTDKDKYYRCVRLRSGNFLLYEFLCNIGMIWDQEKQICVPGNVNEINDSKNEEGNRRNICRIRTNIKI